MALLSNKNKIPLGIYIHVPFCRSKCQYCDFYSLTDQGPDVQEAYARAVCTHIKESGQLSPNHQVDTIYFGGGTPSLLGEDLLSLILTTIRKSFSVSADAEITFEANPDSVNDKLLRRLRSEGFTRVSLGIQCDNDDILKKLGRPHTFQQAVAAVKKIRKAGYKNLSVDLMFGLPGQGLMDWRKTLQHVLKLHPEHISCYGLKVEEGTPLYKHQDQYDLADDDTQADMYLAAVQILRDKGYRQYEISNFCRKGHLSRHNMKYWTGGEYLGFGPNASSDFGGWRFTTVADLQTYIENIQQGTPVLAESQQIPAKERAGEYLMTRLRTVAGITPQEYESRYLLPFAPLEKALLDFKEQGLTARTFDGRWHLTPNGFLISNTIISDLLILQEQSESMRGPQ